MEMYIPYGMSWTHPKQTKLQIHHFQKVKSNTQLIKTQKYNEA